MKALLFDLDGTLVDTIPLWVEANCAALADFGVEMSHEDFLQDYYHAYLHFHGILEKAGVDPSLNEEFYRNRNSRYVEILHDGVEWIDGAKHVLDAVSQMYPLGLMTGSTRRFVEAKSHRLNLLSYFQALVTQDDMRDRMKPDPYGLELICQNMQIDPADALYIGDQNIDTEAAHAIGMASTIIPRGESKEGTGEGAEYVFESIEGILSILPPETLQDH